MQILRKMAWVIDLLAKHIPNDAEEMKNVKRKKHQNR